LCLASFLFVDIFPSFTIQVVWCTLYCVHGGEENQVFLSFFVSESDGWLYYVCMYEILDSVRRIDITLQYNRCLSHFLMVIDY
jgi:hypothetical protein